MKDKNFEYINKTYNTNFKSGMAATANGEPGILLYGDNYVWININGQVRNYHPNDIKLIVAEPSQKTGNIKNGNR